MTRRSDGYLLTMDPSLGDLPRGSLLVRQGRIVEVGEDVSAPGVPVMDPGRIVSEASVAARVLRARTGWR